MCAEEQFCGGTLSVKSSTFIQRINDNDWEPASGYVYAHCQWLVNKVSEQHVDVNSAWANLIFIQFFRYDSPNIRIFPGEVNGDRTP